MTTSPEAKDPPSSTFAELFPVFSPFDCESEWCGWYTGAEVAVLGTSADLHFTGSGRVDLDAAVAPYAWVGYRFEQGGSLRLSYRNLDTSGELDVPTLDSGPQSLRLKVRDNWLDLDYVSHEFVFLESGRFGWLAGGRFVYRELDVKAADSTGEASENTSYFGGGPHAGVWSGWLFGQTGLSVFGRLDGAVAFGQDRNRIQFLIVDPIFIPLAGEFAKRRFEVEADVAGKLGLSWTRSFGRRWLRVEGGVQTEAWGFAGKDRPVFPFRSVGAAGVFLGLEVGF